MKKNKLEIKYFVLHTKIPNFFKYYLKIFLTAPLSLFYKIKLSCCSPKHTDKKYKVSICAIFKNEGLYLKEWIEYHKIVGIDHFYLYNNNSDDNFKEILEPYIKENIVSLIDWPQNQAQIQCYQNCIEKYSGETEWLSFIDIDEFIVPNVNDSNYDFLKAFRKRPIVIAYLRMFGTSGKMSRDVNGLVTEDFTVCWNKYSNIGKIFYNTSYQFDKKYKRNTMMHHYSWGQLGKKYLPPVNIFNKMCIFGNNPVPKSVEINNFPLQINHYFTKSYDEYLQKKAKGDVFYTINPHDEKYFYAHEIYNQNVDYKIYKYLIKLKLALKK
jgi:hypothetical protein